MKTSFVIDFDGEVEIIALVDHLRSKDLAATLISVRFAQNTNNHEQQFESIALPPPSYTHLPDKQQRTRKPRKDESYANSVIQFLHLNSNRSFQLTELAKIIHGDKTTQSDVAAMHKILATMIDKGLVKKIAKGRYAFFKHDPFDSNSQ